ncbi:MULTISPECIES: hypothetical protein [Flammeovirga]|uniref:Uncharacterized protein n=1 Tax=Flammeovirga agarivorans TaxID=2726742 RepID=A0A7X8SIT9_9BACT|nr:MULTISPECIES: hypothetical protein [Flammeovirga]NLR90907.1 hypothetical protein [Flammeovirga agarivorans]
MNKLYILLLPIVYLFSACEPVNEDGDILEADPVGNVFHDVEPLFVKDSLSQLAVNVKILGWQRTERDKYTLHYQLINDSTLETFAEASIAYNVLEIRNGFLSHHLEFDGLDSATRYYLELVSQYEQQLSNIDVYELYTGGYDFSEDSVEVE